MPQFFSSDDSRQQNPLQDADVTVQSDNPNAVKTDPSGAIEIPLEDGSVIIDLNPDLPDEDEDEDDWSENLAKKVEKSQLSTIGETLLEAIDSDNESRADWLETRAQGMDILGLKIEKPKGDIGTSSAPVEGMSVVRHPILLEAVLRFQATARGELLPSTGPVKVRVDSDDTADTTDLAQTLEQDMNYYLTSVATEYYPDTDRMLFAVGFGGCGFKKVYNCPLRMRPVSESVDAQDLIVSNTATNLKSAGRITHVISMRPSILRRMQLIGAYRQIDTLSMTPPTPHDNPVEEKIAEIQGIDITNTRPEDQPYTIYECYCELDLLGYEHKDEDGKITGLALPYRVTIEKDSRQVLDIRRNWDEEDENCLAKTVFVKYPFAQAFGFYDIGLLHILGNSANALTAAWREMLDAGMFATFPGFLVSKASARQNTNEMRVPPGGGLPIETGGQPISTAVMPLPYKDITPGLIGLTQNIEATAQRVGGTADTVVAEGKQEAPVGTTLALIEQATKTMDAVHKRLHQAQSEEFNLLKERFREDPDALWRHNKRIAKNWNREKFVTALNNCAIIPAADPNTPSHMHRIMKAVALKQLQQANPELYNGREVDKRILNMIGWNDPDALFNPPALPQSMPPDPMVQLKQQELQIKGADMKLKYQNSQEDRKSKQDIATIDLAKEIVIHQFQQEQAREQMANQKQQQMHQQKLDVHQQLHEQNLDHSQHQLAVKQAGDSSIDSAVQHIIAMKGQESDRQNSGFQNEMSARQQDHTERQGETQNDLAYRKQEHDHKHAEAQLKAKATADQSKKRVI